MNAKRTLALVALATLVGPILVRAEGDPSKAESRRRLLQILQDRQAEDGARNAAFESTAPPSASKARALDSLAPQSKSEAVEGVSLKRAKRGG